MDPHAYRKCPDVSRGAPAESIVKAAVTRASASTQRFFVIANATMRTSPIPPKTAKEYL